MIHSLIMILLFKITRPLKELSSRSLLLPSTFDGAVFYQISASDGCYQWSSSSPHILEVIPIMESTGCSQKAQVKVTTRDQFKVIVNITAKDIQTGQQLICYAQVDKIKRLQILTNMKTVLVDQLETLELQAYDDKGNVFSSLEGINFSWNIRQDRINSELLTMHEALQQTTPIRRQLEQNHKQSDIIILRGIKNGEVNIQAELYDFEQPIKTEEKLYIIEQFMVFPFGQLNILPCSSIQFQLYKIQNQNNETSFGKIELPSDQYKWIIDSELGTINNKGVFTSGNQVQKGHLEVTDQFSKENSRRVTINIVSPHKMELFISPFSEHLYESLLKGESDPKSLQEEMNWGTNWNLIEGQKYLIKADLFDKENQKIISNIPRIFNISGSSLFIKEAKSNFIVVIAMNVSQSQMIRVKIEHKSCIDIILTANQSFTVHNQIAIIKSEQEYILLPYFQQQQQQQSFLLKALGGSGFYKWEVSDPSIGFIDAGEMFTVRGEGKTQVTCIDSQNPLNKDTLNIVVSKIHDVKFAEPKKETFINENDTVFLTVTDDKNRLFANCTALQFEVTENEFLHPYKIQKQYGEFLEDVQKAWENNQQYFQKLSSSFPNISAYSTYITSGFISEKDLSHLLHQYNNYGLCGGINLQSNQKGIQELKIEGEMGKILPVLTFEKPILNLPKHFDQKIFGQVPTITPGSLVTFQINKGIHPWNSSQKTIHKIENNYGNLFDVTIKEINNDTLEVTVLCNEPKECNQEFKLRSNNENHDFSNQYSQISFQVRCIDPYELAIIPSQQIKNNFDILPFLPQKQFYLENGQKHQLHLQAFDNQHLPFWNNTSILSDWNTDKKSAYFNPKTDSTESILEINQDSDTFKVSAGSSKLSTRKSIPSIQTSSQILCFNKLNLKQDTSTLLNHPQNILQFDIQNGSGQFEISTDRPDLAEVFYDQDNRKILIKPIGQGKVKIFIQDKNQTFQETVVHPLNIVNPNKIELSIEDSIVLRDSIVVPTLSIFAEDQKIPQDQLGFLNLELLSDGASFIDSEKMYLKFSQPGNYSVKLRQKGGSLYSNSVDIVVFDHLSVFPSKIVSYIKCNPFYKLMGGPAQQQFQKGGFSITQIIASKTINENLTIPNDNLFKLSQHGHKIEYQVEFILKKNGKIISSTIADVIILDEITGLQLSGQEMMIKGAKMRLQVIPILGQLPITPAQCEFSFNIHNNSPEILQSNFSIIQRQSFENHFSGAGFDLIGLKEGMGDIQVTLQLGKNEWVVKKYIQVIPNDNISGSCKMGLNCLNCDCCSPFILLMPESPYYLLNEEYYQVNPGINCQIKKNHLICGHQQNQETLVKRYLGLHIESRAIIVQKPYQLVINDSFKYSLLNENSRLEMSIIFLDQVGSIFQGQMDPSSLRFINSDPDVIDVSILQNKLNLNSKKQGKSFLYVQSKIYPHLFDIIEITVGKFVHPSGNFSLHIGDSVKFKYLNNEQFDQFKVGDEKVAIVDSFGKVDTLQPGFSELTIGKNGIHAASFTVHQITSLKPIIQNITQITNIKSNPNYKQHYDILFQAYENNEKITLSNQTEIISTLIPSCTSNQKILKVTPLIMKELGQFGCRVTFHSSDNRTSQAEIQFQITSSKIKDFKVMITQTVQIAQNISLIKEKETIHLTSNSNKDKIIVKTDQEMKISDPHRKELLITSHFDRNQKTQTIYFEAKGENDFEEQITLENQINGQSKKIDVQYTQKSGWFDLSFGFNFLDFLLFIVFVGVIIYLIMKCNTERNEDDIRQYPLRQQGSYKPTSTSFGESVMNPKYPNIYESYVHNRQQMHKSGMMQIIYLIIVLTNQKMI